MATHEEQDIMHAIKKFTLGSITLKFDSNKSWCALGNLWGQRMTFNHNN